MEHLQGVYGISLSGGSNSESFDPELRAASFMATRPKDPLNRNFAVNNAIQSGTVLKSVTVYLRKIYMSLLKITIKPESP